MDAQANKMSEEEYLKRIEEEWRARQDASADFFDELSMYEDFVGLDFDL